MSRSIRSALRLRSIVRHAMRTLISARTWPPPEARLQSILWRAEGHLLRASTPSGVAGRSTRPAGLGEDELVAGLRHLAAAGRRAPNTASRSGPDGSSPMRAGASRPFLPEHARSRLRCLLDAIVESAGGELA